MSEDAELRTLVAEVAAAYFTNSHVTPSEIPMVISQIAISLRSVGAATTGSTEPQPETPKITSAQIRKSITRDALISFEDNKPYKTLRRHLAVRGLTPEQYREKWGLSKDYPMVAPSYSEARAQMARSIGLGSRVSAAAMKAPVPTAGRKAAPTKDVAPEPAAPVAAAAPAPKAGKAPPKRRGRPPNSGDTKDVAPGPAAPVAAAEPAPKSVKAAPKRRGRPPKSGDSNA